MVDSKDFNPDVDGYILSDALDIFAGLSSSSKSVGYLLTHDLGTFFKRAVQNRLPSDRLRGLMERLPENDYHFAGDPKVFLRHGYWTGAACWKKLAKTLLKKEWGINNHQSDYTGSLSELSKKQVKKLEACRERGETIYIIAHSKGALVALWTYQRRPDLFDKIVTLCPPYRGSLMAHRYENATLPFPPFKNLSEFRIDDPDIVKLSQKPLPENVPILNFYLERDEYIKPRSHARLPEQSNIQNIIVPKVRHNHLVYDDLIHRMIVLFLEGQELNAHSMNQLKRGLKRKKDQRRLEDIVRANC